MGLLRRDRLLSTLYFVNDRRGRGHTLAAATIAEQELRIDGAKFSAHRHQDLVR
jgi:hypothetical protein